MPRNSILLDFGQKSTLWCSDEFLVARNGFLTKFYIEIVSGVALGWARPLRTDVHCAVAVATVARAAKQQRRRGTQTRLDTVALFTNTARAQRHTACVAVETREQIWTQRKV